MKRTILPGIFAALLAISAAAAVTPEMPLSGAFRQAANASAVSIGTTADQMLVAWIPSNSASNLYASRVTAGGILLDSVPLLVAADVGQPMVVGAGDRYLVLWSRSSCWGLAVVGTDGTIIGRQSGDCADGVRRIPRAAAFNGREFLVAWQQVRNSTLDNNNVATVVAGDGSVIGDTVPLSGEADAIAVNGSDFLVTSRGWISDPNCGPCRFTAFAQRFAGGQPAAPRPLFAFDMFANPSSFSRINDMTVTDTAGGYLVAWVESNNAPHSDLNVMMLDQNGVPVAAPQTIYSLPGFLESPLKAFRDGDDTIFFVGARYTKAFRYTPGRGVTPAAELPDNNQSVAWNGRDLVVVNPSPAQVKFYNGDLTPDAGRNPVTVAFQAAPQESPRVATSGSTFGVVWTEYRDGDRQVHARVMSRSGAVGDPLFVARGTSPAIASDGVDYMIAFQEGQSIALQRMRADGSLVEGARTHLPQIDNSDSDPVITWNGSEYLVVFASNIYVSWVDQTVAIYGARISRDGALIDTQPLAISPTGGWRSQPGAAWNGHEYLVAWQEQKCVASCWDPKRQVLQTAKAGKLLSASLAPLSDIEIRPFGAYPLNSPLSVTSIGDMFLVSWGENFGISAVRIAADGRNVDNASPILLVSGAGQPNIVARGSSALVAYVAAGDPIAAYDPLAPSSDVLLAAIDIPTSSAPVTVDARAGQPIAATADAEVQPAIAQGADAAAVVYVRRAHEPEYGGSGRVFVRFEVDEPQVRRRAARH